MATTGNESYNLQSLSNALEIIELLCIEPNLGTTEITKRTSLGRSAVFRTLATLESKGYVIKDKNSKYRLSYKFVSIAQNIKQSDTLIPQIHPYLANITSVSGETSHLVVWNSVSDIVFIDKVLSNSSIHMSSMVGLTRIAHLTGTGKALLAFSEPERIQQYMEAVTFPKLTANSIDNKLQLVKELEKIRNEGFAIDNEESEVGLFCIAVPIFQLGNPIAAISISGPAQRMRENMKQNIKFLIETAATISSKIS